MFGVVACSLLVMACMLDRDNVVACNQLVLVCTLDRGGMVAVGRGPVRFSGMFGYLIPCFGCGMPFEFGWLWFGMVGKWGKQAG